MPEEEKKPAEQPNAAQEDRTQGHHNWITDMYDKITIPVKYMDIAVIVLAVIIFVVLLTAGK